MSQRLKTWWLILALLGLAAGPVFGFALLGPVNEAYQTAPIGYGNAVHIFFDDGPNSDVGAPKDFDQGYRWNIPHLYYGFSPTFLTFFGTNGIAEVEKAFAVYNSLTNFSTYSASLSEWPQSTTRVNFGAQTLALEDLKTYVLQAVIEQLGLAQPERWTWALHTRDTSSGTCPNFTYLVIQRNFDSNGAATKFVNGNMYTYTIEELCAVTPNVFAPLLADAVEFASDPAQEGSSDNSAVSEGAFAPGSFITSLTREDVAGLRFLMITNRVQVEAAPSGALLQSQTGTFTPVISLDLATLAALSATGTPATVSAAFPGIIILSAQPYVTNILTTNLGPPVIITTTPVQRYIFTFGNVITNSVFNQGIITTTTSTIAVPPQAPVGSPGVTNTSSSTSVSNYFNGDFFILPTTACGYTILVTNLNPATQIVLSTVTTTNSSDTQTNIVTVSRSFSSSTIILSVPTCTAGNVALRQGMDQIQFFPMQVDSLIGQAITPVTDTFRLTAVSNGVPITQTFQRVVTTPDILFVANDPVSGTSSNITAAARSTPNFSISPAPTGPGGPGTINPPVTFTLDRIGHVLENSGGFFTEGKALQVFQWATFDGTTNPPAIYPSSTSLADLENQIYLQITLSGPLANGHVGAFYTANLVATGAQPPPYTWSLAASSPGLPPGLGISPTTGTISGTPTVAGIYDFVVQVADTVGRANQRSVSIEIDP